MCKEGIQATVRLLFHLHHILFRAQKFEEKKQQVLQPGEKYLIQD